MVSWLINHVVFLFPSNLTLLDNTPSRRSLISYILRHIASRLSAAFTTPTRHHLMA